MSGCDEAGRLMTSKSLCPVGRIHRLLRKGNYVIHVDAGAPVYMVAVMEYVVAEIEIFNLT